MADSEAPPSEALKPSKSPAIDRLPKQTACSSDTDGSASVDEDELSDSGSDDSCEQVRRGGSRRATPLRKRRKRPEWTRNEEETLAQVHCSVGNQWSVIASRLPGRTANEVKNIWHSTLRSKHLKARSLLRAYATALNGRWDDETARQEAYNAALGQQGTGGSEARTSARPLEAGSLPAGDERHDDLAQTPRLGAATNLIAAGGLPTPSPAQAQTPDSGRSPKATLVRQRTGRGPPATAPRPVANLDKAAGRGGQQRQQLSGAARRPASPMSCPARGLQARANLIETRGASTAQVKRNFDTLAMPLSAPAPEGDAVTMADVDAAATPRNGYVQPPTVAATTAARPLPLPFGGAFDAPTQLPPRRWPQPHLLQANSNLGLQESQPPRQLQEQQQQQPPVDQRPRNGVQLLHCVATKGEQKERVEGTLPHPSHGPSRPSHGQVLALNPMGTWLGRLGPSMVMHDDEAAAREQLRRDGADSANNSSVARAIGVSTAAGPGDGPGDAHQVAGASEDLVESGRSRLLTWPRPGQLLPGPPNAAAHHGRAGPASGAWSSNNGAEGSQLQSPQLDSEGLMHVPAPQAAAPDTTMAMAISPTSRDGGGAGGGDGVTPASGAQDFFSQPAVHWHVGDSAAAAYGSQDRVPALPFALSGAAGMYPAPPDVKADPDGSGCEVASLGWPLAAPPRPPLPFVVKPGGAGLAHEGWHGPLPSPQQLAFRSGVGGMAPAADVRGGMYMVPVHTPPSAPPPPPLPQMVYAAPQHALQAYHGHPQYDVLGRQQRQHEQMMMYQQQHYIQQQQQQDQQQQQQYEQQEQFKQQQAYQHAGQWQQQQFKQEPQEEQRYQQQFEQQQQQHLLLQLSDHHRLQQSHPQHRLPQQQQNLHQQPVQQQAQQPLEQYADSMSSSEIVTMGLDSLQDPQLRWCLADME